MKQELEQAIAAAAQALLDTPIEVELTRPEEKFGDYATNVAMQLAKPAGKNPREIAESLAAKFQEDLKGQVSEVLIAGPGFINLKLTDKTLLEASQTGPGQSLKGQEILVEFGDPNPFKEMHIGHVYSYIVGDSIARLLEVQGARVHRLSYHGDVGLHIAKAIWGMQKEEAGPSADSIGSYYAKGAKAYEEDEKAREEIHAINEHVYKKDNPEINKLYDWGRQKSFEYFGVILEDLGVKTDKQYFESETAAIGLELVRANTGKVFKESDGAIIYDGEKAGLHTRVFITSKGLPTYETKDLGLAELKRRDYKDASRSVIITANEQSEYFKVMLAALKEFDKPLADSITHLSHGFVSLSTGKMSSRTGKVLRAEDVLTHTKLAISNSFQEVDTQIRDRTMQGAIKYAFLKNRVGGDIIYDPKESVSLEGNSGPYLQYSHARARSILGKAGGDVKELPADAELEAGERSLVRKLGEYAEAVDKAVAELMPHHVCTYLYELAQTFNRFYEQSRVIGDEREALRLGLVNRYADTLKNGLELLGIPAPDKM